MSLGLIAIIILMLIVIGAVPTWSHSGWGYAPSGALGTVLPLVILFLLGRL